MVSLHLRLSIWTYAPHTNRVYTRYLSTHKGFVAYSPDMLYLENVETLTMPLQSQT